MKSSAIKSPSKNLTFDEFSKSKFTELKAKFPSKTDKEIFGLVNKQWQQTNTKARNQSSISSIKMESNLQGANVEDQVGIRAKTKLIFQQQKTKKEQTKREQMKEESQIQSQRSSVKATPIKKKTIQKLDRTEDKFEQKKFFKFYEKKLHEEHPKWTKAQIAEITKLLWRKKISQQKKSRVQRIRSFKPLGARKCFGDIKRAEGMTNQQIKKIWKRLPAQTKKYYGFYGSIGRFPNFELNLNTTISSKKTTSSSIVDSFSKTPLSFLNKAI